MPPTEQPILIHIADGALTLLKDGSTQLERRDFWAAILVCGGLGIAFLVWPCFVPPPVPSALLVLTGIAASIALGLVVVEVGKFQRRPDRGSWRLGATGVEFHSLAGVRNQLAWADVERIYWTDEGVRLHGATDQVAFSPRFLTPDDWQALRDRIAAGLTPRLPLKRHEPPRPIRPGRVALAVLPIGMIAAWFHWILPILTLDQIGLSSLVMLAFLVLPLTVAGFGARTIRRHNPAWRRPRIGG